MKSLLVFLLFLAFGCDVRHEKATPAHDFTYEDFGPVVVTVSEPALHDEPNRYTINVRWTPRGSFPVVIYRSAGSEDFKAIGASHSSSGHFEDQVPHRARYRYYVTSLNQDLAESRSHIVEPEMPSPDIVVEGHVQSRGYVGYNRVFFRDNTRVTVLGNRFLIIAAELHMGRDVEIVIPDDPRDFFQPRTHILSFEWHGKLKISRPSRTYHVSCPVLIDTAGEALVSGEGITSTKISHDHLKMLTQPPDTDPYWKSEEGKRDLEQQAVHFHNLLEMFPNREFTKEPPAHLSE